jgi:uncharacterized protein YecE (DUF72 family)
VYQKPAKSASASASDDRSGKDEDGMSLNLFVGTAGWALPKEAQPLFPAEGTHLQRYAARFPAVEINSSFYRPHQPKTYARWAASVGEHFRFAVKVPRTITHEHRLRDVIPLLEAFLSEVSQLGDHLGCLLVQLPPSLAFGADVAALFLQSFRERFTGAVVLEPRHASWFTDEATQLLETHRVARVVADPAPVPAAAEPGGWFDPVYVRLHGSPRMYYSPYDDDYLDALAIRLLQAARSASVWCIFDNTAEGAATHDALALLKRLSSPAP